MPLVLAEILFGQPALLGGIALAALPIIIHLLLRPRPRRTRFPAIVLLRRVVLTGQRSSRLRNLLLMSLRAACLAALALLLAGPVRSDGVVPFVTADPVACAIVLDDSASMTYRSDASTTRLDLSRAAATDLVRGAATWPAGSALAALTSAMRSDPMLELDGNRAAALDRLNAAGARESAQPLGSAISAAGQLLRTAHQPVRRLVVCTDGAATAWRDVNPVALAGIDNLAVRVITSGHEPQSNLALTSVEGLPRLQPATAKLPMQAAISAEGVDTTCWLTISSGGQKLERIGPVQTQPGGIRQVSFELPPLPPGPHVLTFELEPADRMDFDQRRYLAVQTAEPPLVWLVGATDADADLSALIFRNLLAPDVLKLEQQRVRLVSFSAEQMPAQVDASSQQQPVLILVLSNASLSREALATLLSQLERGATVVLAPASTGSQRDWPGLRELLSDAPPANEELSDAASLTWDAASEFASHPELLELSRCGIRRRLRVENLRTGCEVHARYADDRPAILSRRRGAGQLLLLTTSPDPEWSDLGIRAAGLISWLHLLVDEAVGPPDAIASFELGQQARNALAALPATGLVRVACETRADAKPTWTRLKDHAPEQFWPTELVGAYTLEPTGAAQLSAAYTVNWPPDESALTPISAAQIQRALGVPDVRLESADSGAADPPGLLARLFAIRDLRKVLAAVVMLLFAGELLLTRRQTATSTEPVLNQRPA